MFVNNFITSTDLKAYLTWKLQIAITNPKAYFFLNYHLLNIRNNLHYIMINFYLNKTRLNGGQVAPHIVHRLKIKRAKREKRHRLQTTDMTSLACQILLLARNGSRYFYRSFFFFFPSTRTAPRGFTILRINGKPSFLHNVYFCPSSYTFNDHFNTPRIIHPRAIKFFLFLSFRRVLHIENGNKEKSEIRIRSTSTRSESSHNFTSHVPFWTDAKFQIFYLNLMIFMHKYFKNISLLSRQSAIFVSEAFSSILEAKTFAWKRREKLENIF